MQHKRWVQAEIVANGCVICAIGRQVVPCRPVCVLGASGKARRRSARMARSKAGNAKPDRRKKAGAGRQRCVRRRAAPRANHVRHVEELERYQNCLPSSWNSKQS